MPEGESSGHRPDSNKVKPHLMNQGIEPSVSQRVQDALENPTSRRKFLSGLATGALGLTAVGTMIKEGSPKVYSGDKQPLPQSTTPEVKKELNNQINPVLRTENGLEAGKNPDVVQYVDDPEFAGVNGDPFVKLRTEIDVSTEDNVKRVPARQLNELGIGVSRAGAIGWKANNGTYDDPNYCFKVKVDGVDEFEYEWLFLSRKVEPDPNNPNLFIDESDGTRSIQVVDDMNNPVDREQVLFTGPNYVNTVANKTSH